MKQIKQNKLTTAQIISLGIAAQGMAKQISGARSWDQVRDMLAAAAGMESLTVANVTKIVHGAGINLRFKGVQTPKHKVADVAARLFALEERVKLLEECLGGTGTRA